MSSQQSTPLSLSGRFQPAPRRAPRQAVCRTCWEGCACTLSGRRPAHCSAEDHGRGAPIWRSRPPRNGGRSSTRGSVVSMPVSDAGRGRTGPPESITPPPTATPAWRHASPGTVAHSEALPHCRRAVRGDGEAGQEAEVSTRMATAWPRRRRSPRPRVDDLRITNCAPTRACLQPLVNPIRSTRLSVTILPHRCWYSAAFAVHSGARSSEALRRDVCDERADAMPLNRARQTEVPRFTDARSPPRVDDVHRDITHIGVTVSPAPAGTRCRRR